MSTYQYTISTDFSSGVASDRLSEEIGDDATITTDLLYMTADYGADELDIEFDGTLTSGEETALDALVAAHSGDPLREWVAVSVDPVIEAVDAGTSRVIANDRPALEIGTGITGFGAIQGVWPLAQEDYAELRVTMKFILKASGTGSNVRLAARAKFQGTGDDSAATWDDSDFAAVGVSYTTVGEVFEGEVLLDASDANLGDAVALQIGRDGNNTLGSGTNDDVNQAIQIISLKVEAR